MTDEPLTTESDRVASVEHVAHAYGSVSVLDDVSFDVEAGSSVALLGPNGSGKTTLMRIVAGLMRPSDGAVRVATDAARPVGYLPQDPAFRPVFTVEETLSFYADLLDAPVDVPKTVDRVGLTDASDRRVDALSGGMRRLLGIAQATLGDPSLVLMDEPTGDLDPLMTDYVFEVVDDLAADGIAVLFATHDLTGATDADEVLLLDRGSIVADGSPDEFAASVGAESLHDAFRTLVGGETLSVRAGREASAVESPAGGDA